MKLDRSDRRAAEGIDCSLPRVLLHNNELRNTEHSESTSRLPTGQLVLHDLEPHLLTATQLVQPLQPTTLRHQVLIAHPAPDILHVHSLRSAYALVRIGEYPRKDIPHNHQLNIPTTDVSAGRPRGNYLTRRTVRLSRTQAPTSTLATHDGGRRPQTTAPHDLLVSLTAPKQAASP